MALKASQCQPVTRNDDESDESYEDDEMVSFITKCLAKFIRKGISMYKNQDNGKTSAQNLKKISIENKEKKANKRKKSKAMIAKNTWSDTKSSDDEEVCLMAKKEIDISEVNDFSDPSVTVFDLSELVKDLSKELLNCSKMYNRLYAEHEILLSKSDDFAESGEETQSKLNLLKAEVDKLKGIVESQKSQTSELIEE
ncbi:hypothetical protein Droror1_Dr00027656 [Drosera rotundifolia]